MARVSEAAIERNRTYAREKMRRWRAENPDAARINVLVNNKGVTREEAMKGFAVKTDYCEACGQPEAEEVGALHFDHCHQTGRFRGWLCQACNKGLGFFRDDPHRLRLALAYLDRRP